MKNNLKKYIVPFLLLCILCNFKMVNGLASGRYYSTELIEGTVLKWEVVTNKFYPTPEISSEIVEITILQDIPNQPLSSISFNYYCSITIGGEELDNITVNILFPSYVYPVLYVDENVSSTYFEYQSAREGEFMDINVEQKRGDVIVNVNFTREYFTATTNLTVHEKTGIAKKKIYHVIDPSYEYILTATYLGDLKLVQNDLSVILLVLIGFPLVQVIIQRKRRKNQPP